MQQRQVNKPISVNLDKSKKYLTPTEAFYMLNRERNINGTGTLGKTTPLVANYLACLIDQPAGDNYTIGHYFSELTNELYWWVYNTNAVHYIARIIGDGSCEIVYDGDCLSLSAAPEHAIEEWRCYLKYDRYCAHQHGKQLIWTDGENEIGMIDVEASIATNSFTTPFFDICTDDCAPVQMCVPEPCGALQGEFIPLPADEVDLNNHLVDVGFKVRFRWIYYDQRASEWSDISTLYFQNSKGCFDVDEGFPRCMKFTIPLGNPLVDKIEFAYSTDNGITWKSSDVIEKYEPYSSSTQYWYQRDLAALDDLNLDDCTFSYTFCMDKECNPIATKETSRVFNPMPRQPQGMLPFGDKGLGFYNYLKGTCPLDGSETEKFTVGIDCPSGGNCLQEFAEVTVFAIIVNRMMDFGGCVYRLGGNSPSDPDDDTEVARFGHQQIVLDAPIPDGMGQFFYQKKIRNFIAYVDGTDHWAQMEQYKSDANFKNTQKVGIISGIGNPNIALAIFQEIMNGKFYYQQFKVKVPKGTRGYIRIASQKAGNGLPLEGQDSSTFVVGTIPDIRTYYGYKDVEPDISSYTEELYFDTCSGDVTLYETLVIDDNYKRFETGYHSSSAYAGYITDADNDPVEGAEIWVAGSKRAISDFNGFYHFWLLGSENTETIGMSVRVETSCVGGFNQVKSVIVTGSYNTLTETDIQITNTDFPAYTTDFYEDAKVAVIDCDSQPVGGIRVSMKGTKYQVSDAVTGLATFKIRNYSNRARFIRGVILDSNNCFSQNCSSGCNPCLPATGNVSPFPCFSGVPTITLSTDSNLNIDTALTSNKGLKAGGRYPFAIVAQGDCGRISAAYPITILNGSLPAVDNYINVPKTQEKGILNFCTFNYDANGMVLPDWVKCLKLCRGANVNNYELQWLVDKIERKNGQIKLTIQSLNDYNAAYNFETNTIYQYQKNDRVEFINNGDGTIFDIATYGLLNFQILSPFHDKVISGQTEAPADFFNQILIDDDGTLDDLTIGAKIELQRPRECTVEPTYYEILSLDVVEISGQKMLANPTGTFTTFDTYILYRQIELVSATIGYPTQQFEHKFPSDFWGEKNSEGIFTGISDIGKVHFVNKFENEKRVGRNITINSPNQYNRFGDLEKTLDAPEQGDIIAMAIYDAKIGLGIGQIDNFLFQISDDFLRIGSSGVVQAAPVDSIISDTQPKIKGIFGCQYSDIGSIFFGDGFATWMDNTSGSFVKHDFNLARDISEGKFKLWVKKRFQFMYNFNKTAPNDVSKLRFFTGLNLHTGALQLTLKALNQGGTNNEQEPFIDTKDTILIEPNSEELLTFASYTPEGYSNIILDNSTGCAFVTWFNGSPFIHPIIPIKFDEFFGQAVDTFVGISIHHETGDKEINPMAMEVQDETMWFAKKITVDKAAFESMIPPIRWRKTMDKWNAEFLCNINARGGLYGNDSSVAGEKPRGYFCAVTLCRDNTNALIYNSTNDAKRILFDELDLIISKASFAESSGFTGNV